MRYPEDRTLVIVLRNQEAEDSPGELKKLKIVYIGKGLSAIAFGLIPPTATRR